MHAAVKQIETHGFELTTRGQHLGDVEGDSRNPSYIRVHKSRVW